MKLGRNSIIAIGAIVLVIALIVSGTPLLSVFGGFSTDTEEFKVSKLGVGSITGHIEFTDTAFVSAWDDASVKSEKATVKRGFIEPFVGIKGSYIKFEPKTLSGGDKGLMKVKQYWYEYYYKGVLIESTPKFDAFILSATDDGVTYEILPSEYFQVQGPETGELEVVLKADLLFWKATGLELLFRLFVPSTNLFFGDVGTTEEVKDVALSKDGARFKSGFGQVKTGGDLSALIEEGEDIKFLLQTGFTGGDGWTVFIRPPLPTGLQKITYGKFGDNTGPVIKSFTVPIGWFTPGQPDQECVIELWNEYWEESRTAVFIIDNKALAPTGNPDGAIDLSGNLDLGGTVTVTMSGKVNTQTKSPIDGFWLYVYYGVSGSQPGASSQDWIVNKQWVDASKVDDTTYSGKYQYNTKRSGTITAHVVVVDEAGRPSEPVFAQQFIEDEGNGNWEPQPPVYPDMWNIFAVVTLAIGLLSALAYFVLPNIPNDQFSQLTGIPKIVPVIIIIAVTLFVAWYFKTSPELSTWVLNI